MDGLNLLVPVSLASVNSLVFEGLLASDGIISFTYPDGSGPFFTFRATLLNGGGISSTAATGMTVRAPS